MMWPRVDDRGVPFRIGGLEGLDAAAAGAAVAAAGAIVVAAAAGVVPLGAAGGGTESLSRRVLGSLRPLGSVEAHTRPGTPQARVEGVAGKAHAVVAATKRKENIRSRRDCIYG